MLMLAILLMGGIGVVQQSSPVASPEPDPPSDDIVVNGLRDLERPDSAVTHRTLGSSKNGRGPVESRQAFGLATRFARCAIGPKMRDVTMLRSILDGTINSANQSFWQRRFVNIHAACAQDISIAQNNGLATVWQGYDTSYYDRGALFIEAIRDFAPDLSLRKRDTADPVVQARFNAREEKLARFRLPVDRRYFEAAVCLVRLQPELAVKLVKTENYGQVSQIEAALVNRAKICVGNAQKVYFDPMQFRFYIADAVYRWAVAARGTDTLIRSSTPG